MSFAHHVGSNLTLEQAAYADLMEEARVRIQTLIDNLNNYNSWAPRLLQEFAYLQFRMLCETIAIGCLVVHGDIKDRAVLKTWRADEIINKLSALNPDFFPHGIRIRTDDHGVHCDPYPVPQITKSELVDLWEGSGGFLHRGSAKSLISEHGKIHWVNLDLLVEYGKRITNLLDQHYITSADKKSAFIVALGSGPANAIGTVKVWTGAPPQMK